MAAEKGTGEYDKFSYVYDLAKSLYASLAEDQECWENPEQKPLMICGGCHEAGCWGLYVTVEETDTEIIWSNISNYHMTKKRPDKKWWDYSVFPTFRFDKTEYRAALEQLRKIADGDIK